ncbi:MAG: hypothetical protein J7J34_00070 [Thermoplasmata archaeon]|nr:hypothetical protein [Thermoplasmata archaeon]
MEAIKMKMIAILACMLLVTTILPVVGPMDVDKTVAVEKSIQADKIATDKMR